jgi:hypothetical protein
VAVNAAIIIAITDFILISSLKKSSIIYCYITINARVLN